MSRYISDELRRLLGRLERQCARVLGHLDASLALLRSDDRSSALVLARRDEEINREEVLLEEECLRIVALHQPVGSDLRLLSAVLKANNDLERAADHATNLLRALPGLPPPASLPDAMGLLANAVRDAFARAISAWTERDPVAARLVLSGDGVVDRLEAAAAAGARALGARDPAAIEAAFLLARAAHDLERVGDLAVNLAESVLHLETGEIVRHRRA